MSSTKELMQIINDQQKRFTELDQANGNILNFKQECLFARQQIIKSDFTLDVASKNPASLQASILNVAAIGISLNPALQHAFLVPRDGHICLDLSYRGLTKIATDAGAIKWAKAELVYENDTFKYLGINKAPEFSADVFGDRGKLRGGYCIAKLPDGEVLVDTMPIDEIHKVRDSSKAYTKKKAGPWVDWYEEMCKKTLIKRAYKTWPQTPNRVRLDKAIDVLNESEGIAYTPEQYSRFHELVNKGDPLEFFLFKWSLEEGTYAALYNSFPQGKKTEMKRRVQELDGEGVNRFQAAVDYLVERIDESDYSGVCELLEEFGAFGAEKLIGALDPDKRELYEILRKEAA